MAPIRRYLRISKYSVLECRIYLENPALVHSWLLNPRKPVLPKVIESVRPYVLPKLREERERSRKRSTKKKGIKDVVVQDDFEVSIFLTETSTRHSLVTKHKHFHDTTQTRLTSNSGRLISETNDGPADVEAVAELDPVIRREESDEDNSAVALAAIPLVDESIATGSTRPPKRARSSTIVEDNGTGHHVNRRDSDVEEIPASDDDEDDGDDGLFVQSPTEDLPEAPPPKRRRAAAAGLAGRDDEEDKKKLTMDISYEGFSIYGRVLCLVVKRREVSAAEATGRNAGSSTAATGSTAPKAGGRGKGQTMMENFILSTQVPAGTDVP
ncbi:hypothetical protein F5Y17DRAFT_455046 [Xylariaceae sp. FL0594]|nr:hypothetical protein F5Y17DRAFT_455046 [Xylariaceae sp. FL0594]